MQKLIDDLKAAIAAEENKTPALSVMSALALQLEERFAEHAAKCAAGVPPAAPKSPAA